ncbi:MAG: isoprenylcysteine carboxylmethyltransferase family protein [Desulfobacterales bacterium]|nr:isoprenylcysteine carboxylmethyltransferase family protein [Desulfobacterales bacterium]
MFITGIVLVGAAALGRMWCSLYIAGYKDEKLITKGPYSLCRNPLYFFSMVGLTGIGLCTESITLTVAFLVLFAVYYPFVIKREEMRLASLFGKEFMAYRCRVPAFIPKMSIYEEPDYYTVRPSVYRVHIFSALWFVWGVGVIEIIRGLRNAGLLTAVMTLY